MSEETGAITQLLGEVRRGDEAAFNKLASIVYRELRRQARVCLGRERAAHSIQATELVHEAWIRLASQEDKNWENRAHFFALSARVMRNLLVDHARRRRAERRGGEIVRVELDEGLTLAAGDSDEVLRLNDSLDRLAQIDPRQSRIVELRFFGGLSVEEVSAVLDISERTVKRELSMARAWLYGEVRRGK